MPKIYHKLYDAAKLDGLSAEILNKNNLHAPAIYHCAQAVEKCLKATYAYYMMKVKDKSEHEIAKLFSSKDYGHDLQKSCEGFIKSLFTLRFESEVKQDNKKQAQEELHLVKGRPLEISYAIPNFDEMVDRLYKGYREVINGKFESLDLDEQVRLAAKEFLDEDYVRYMIVVMNLSVFLTPFETYSRYPMKELSYNNISMLNNTKNKKAINHICLMIDEALNRVVDVWKQIDRFKNKMK